MDHIGKWRSKLFVIGFYSKEARRPELLRSLCLTPADMAPWIDAIEAKIAIDFRIAEKSSRALTESDLLDVCGAKPHYTVSDARSVLKQQWSVREYEQAADMSIDKRPAYSPAAMLRILQRRALYIAQRGATLNNPRITKTHLARFFGTDREVTTDWAQSIRAVARDWLQVPVR